MIIDEKTEKKNFYVEIFAFFVEKTTAYKIYWRIPTLT